MSAIALQDIVEYLATQDDFDLELFAYRALREHGIPVASHGGTYLDPVAGKIRQFDIRASLEFGKLGWGVNVAIECKSLSAEFPLVVSRVPRPVHESHHYLIKSWGREEMGERFSEPILADKGLVLYGTGEPVGKHTFQIRRDSSGAFKTGDTETYDKWSQALASAADLIELAREGHIRYRKSEFLTLVLPILVVSDGTLWTVDYDEDGNRSEPKSAEECMLWVEREYPARVGPAYTITHLHIYTRRGFVSFLKRLTAPASRLIEHMFGHAARAR